MPGLLDIIKRAEGSALDMHRRLLESVAAMPENAAEAKAQWIENWLYENGICRIARIDAVDDHMDNPLRPNLVACFRPKGIRHMLWLITHLDMLASTPTGDWTSSPFKLRVDGDRLYGLGVEDNHQGIVSALLLFDGLKQLDGEGLPKLGLGLICVSTGLTDYEKSLATLAAKHPELFCPNDLYVVPNFGNEEGSLITINEKNSLTIRITVTGGNYHAGYVKGSNAFEAAAKFISNLDILREKYAYPDDNFVPNVSTITPTFCESSSASIDHVAGKFTFYLDVRLTLDVSGPRFVHALQSMADQFEADEAVKFDFEFVRLSREAPAAPPDTPVVKILSEAIASELGVNATLIGAGGGSAATGLRAMGLPAVNWCMHSGEKIRTDESISLKKQILQTCVFARMLYAQRVPQGQKVLFTAQQKAQNVTPTEFRIAELLGRGLSNDELCAELSISHNTLRTHLKHLYRKTDARNRHELYRLCAMLW
ncbi:LuxR C-terminal-related transcriptional regulator [Bartonella sp. LJL80]